MAAAATARQMLPVAAARQTEAVVAVDLETMAHLMPVAAVALAFVLLGISAQPEVLEEQLHR